MTASDDIRLWVDGELVPATAGSVSALDHGSTVGDGAFEVAKIVDGAPFALSRHHARLARSLAGLGLPAPDLDALDAGIAAVLGPEAGPTIGFGRLRYWVTAGLGPLGSDRLHLRPAHPTIVVAASPVDRPPESGALVTVPWTRNERSATVGLKTLSYADNVLALREATSQGAIEAVFANTRGELCECTGSNIFVVPSSTDGVIVTPPADSGLLLGITRELTITWCREAGIEVREEALPLHGLQEVDEVFITSTTKDVLPIHRVDDRELVVGPVSRRAREIFTERARQDLDP